MPGFFRVTPGELFFLKLGVRKSGEQGFELWDVSDDKSSSASPAKADVQLWSELLKRLMHCSGDSASSTKAETQHVLIQCTTLLHTYGLNWGHLAVL